MRKCSVHEWSRLGYLPHQENTDVARDKTPTDSPRLRGIQDALQRSCSCKNGQAFHCLREIRDALSDLEKHCLEALSQMEISCAFYVVSGRLFPLEYSTLFQMLNPCLCFKICARCRSSVDTKRDSQSKLIRPLAIGTIRRC